jgi:translation initiation factor 2B subunit (eIF-2B alpha/beta/delta family)
MASIHNRKLTAAMTRELREKDEKIKQLSNRVVELENTMKMVMEKLRVADSDLNLER